MGGLKWPACLDTKSWVESEPASYNAAARAAAQLGADLARVGIGHLEARLVEHAHGALVLIALQGASAPPGPAVARPGDPQQLALPYDWDLSVSRVD